MAESRDEFGVGFHLFVAGCRVGVRPLELVDFLVSPFSLDPCHDNMSWAERQRLHQARQQAREAGDQAEHEGSVEGKPEG